MRSSRWQAQGNVYLVAEGEPLTAEAVRRRGRRRRRHPRGARPRRRLARGHDLEPRRLAAEMSGNGTRIAARWLAEQTGANDVDGACRPTRGGRADARQGQVEQDLGPVAVGAPEKSTGIRSRPVDVGNPHAVVEDDPAELPRVGPQLETHPRFPQRTNVQVARRLDAGRSKRASGNEAWGRRLVRHERGRGRRGARRQPGDDPLPGRRARSCGSTAARAYLTGPAERVE